MNRRSPWPWILGAAFAALIGIWFFHNFEQVPVERWSEMGKEARRNRLLAMERFLKAMGRPLSRASNAVYLDKPPPGGAIILDNQRRTHMTPERVERLLAWVKEGGYLIVVPESPGVEDPLLAFFHVGCGCEVDKDSEEAGDGEDEKARDDTPPDSDPDAKTASQDNAPEETPQQTPQSKAESTSQNTPEDTAGSAPENPSASTPEDTAANEKESQAGQEEAPADGSEETQTAEKAKAAAEEDDPPQTLTVAIPGAPRPLTVAFTHGRLRAGKTAPQWQVGAPDWPADMIHFAHGKGNVTILGGFYGVFVNEEIGAHDHAEFLWTLLDTYAPGNAGPVTMVSRLVTTKLGGWLMDTGWTALVAALALLGLWLWSVIPRFGQVRPTPAPDRRQLSEHLAAIGRYVWRQGGLDHWLETARESFRARLALRHPAIASLPPAEQVAALGHLTQRPSGLIAAALFQPASSPQSFTLALRALRTLERVL